MPKTEFISLERAPSLIPDGAVITAIRANKEELARSKFLESGDIMIFVAALNAILG